MSARTRIVWSGLRELRAALRQLPADLQAEARGIVDDHMQTAAQGVRANYTAHRRTGDLASSVVVTALQPSAFAAGGIVRVTAAHAHLFEHGTAARQTAQGADRGVMPPAPPLHAFIPVVVQERHAMYEDLKDVLRRAGLEVRGDA